MKINKRIVLAVFVVCILLVGWYIALAGEPEKAANETLSTLTYAKNKRDVLNGLREIYVIVEYIEPEVEKKGLIKQVIETDVELELRKYGIKVVSEEESLKKPGGSFLYVNVNANTNSSAILTGAISVNLSEAVMLLRSKTVVLAQTWSVNGVLFSSSDSIFVRDSIKSIVDKFINDYLAANPKEPLAVKDTADSNNL
ncbi:MAG: hypothetical protein ABII09_04305 [Planctomycetota bacterium]